MTKGSRRETQAKKYYESEGYEVYKKVNNRYDRGDIFGKFDLVCIAPDQKVKFVQVKSNSTQGALKELKNYSKVPYEYAEVELIIYYDYKGKRIERLKNNKWKTIMDERKT